MMDEMDRVQALEQQDRDVALHAALARIAASFAPRDLGVDGQCIDCGEPIEPKRLAALDHKTSRCASCARDHEQRLRRQR